MPAKKKAYSMPLRVEILYPSWKKYSFHCCCRVEMESSLSFLRRSYWQQRTDDLLGEAGSYSSEFPKDMMEGFSGIGADVRSPKEDNPNRALV